MSQSPAPACYAVTVTYHPDLALLERQLASLRGLRRHRLVDNASPPALRAGLTELAVRYPWVELHLLDTNLGLAAAVNRGVAALPAAEGQALLLLLDQDTEWPASALPQLLAEYQSLQAAAPGDYLLGPALRDPDTGLVHAFHGMSRWRWQRYRPAPTAPPLPVASVNGSGSLLSLALFRRLGGLDEALFIDHVDTEFSFRAAAAGCQLRGVPRVELIHRMGEQGRRVWLGGWHLLPQRSPQRHRYLYRNTLWLWRRDYVPRVWKVWALAKLGLTAMLCLLGDPRRWQQLKQMAGGLREGLHPPRPGRG